MAKFKSSLLTTVLIGTSLWGSKPHIGKVQLQPQSKKVIVQTTVREEFLPPCTKKEMNLFNASPEVLALKEEHDLLQQKKEDISKQYSKALQKKQHAKQHVPQKVITKTTIVRRKIDKSVVYASMSKYETLFKAKLTSVIKDQGLSEGLSDLFYKLFLESYVRCSFFELIQYPIANELLAKWQTTSMRFLQEISEKELINGLSIYGNIAPTNSCIAMLQEGYIELLKKYKELSGNDYFYWHARAVLAGENYEESMKRLIELDNECENSSIKYENASKVELTELIKFFKDNNVDLPNEINIETMYNILTDKAKKDETFKIKFKTNDILRKVVFEKKEALDEYVSKLKEIQEVKNLMKNAEIERTKTMKECDRAYAEYSLILKKKDAQQPSQTKTFIEKQTPMVGRKAIPQSFSTSVPQKQMKQAPKTKTLEDLDNEFGKDLDKALDKLEVFTIEFDSEDEWNEFINNTEIAPSTSHQSGGSHQSQEIFFDFEGQTIKGKLVGHYTHGRDTKTGEKITHKITIMRRIQK